QSSVARDSADNLMYMPTAHNIWADLHDRFHESNSRRSYQIKKEELWDKLRDYRLTFKLGWIPHENATPSVAYRVLLHWYILLGIVNEKPKWDWPNSGMFNVEQSDHSIGYPCTKASGESSTTKHRLLHASGPHPIPPPNDPN
ncbi:hypothetical protein F511_19521, partial [Dorcoceras hygrometricum]